MANKKITELTALTSAATDDLLAIVDVTASETKKITAENLVTLTLLGVTSTATQLNYLNAATGTTGTTSTNLVFSTSPTLVTPVLGTPQSGNLSNCTALPLGSLTGLGTGVATFLATPSSANLASAVTGETGTGALVFGTAPTFTTSISFNDVTDTIAGIQNQNLVDKADTETITGTWTFSTNFPLTPSSAPTTDYQVANKKYVVDTAGTVFHSVASTQVLTNGTQTTWTDIDLSATVGANVCLVLLIGNIYSENNIATLWVRENGSSIDYTKSGTGEVSLGCNGISVQSGGSGVNQYGMMIVRTDTAGIIEYKIDGGTSPNGDLYVLGYIK